jgi:hypothetical protein
VATQDEICPGEIGERWIRLSLADPLAKRQPYEPIEILCGYAKADAAGGIVLPLELLITGPDRAVERRLIQLFVPDSISFTPRVGGLHTVLLREVAHNRWTGVLRVDVETT